MYPSSNNCNQTPIPCDIYRQASNSEINPSPQFEDYFFKTYSPSIHYTDEVNDQTWLQLKDFLGLQSVTNDDKTASNIGETKRASSNELRIETKSKSCSKKDRHSKIRTAKGLRDRRMRLSLDVARKLFDLQDFLGFDKASKTVEWLLTKSDTAIKEMERGLEHTTSECDFITSTTYKNQQPSVTEDEKMKSHFKEEKKAKVPHISKESRKNARERARKRTTEKRKVGESKVYFGGMDRDYTGLESQSTVTENLGAQDQKLPWERSRDAADHDSLLFSGNWNTCAVCFYQ